MSRNAEVIVLAPYADYVMEPLTRDDPERTWSGRFVPIESQWEGSFGFGWATEFEKMRSRAGLFRHLESLPWPNPGSVQVLTHDQDDECFALWMLHDGRLVEVALAHTQRIYPPAKGNDGYPPDPGYLVRTDLGRPLSEQTLGERPDPRLAW